MPLHCISFSTISAALTRRSELPRAIATGLVETVMNMTDVVDQIDARAAETLMVRGPYKKKITEISNRDTTHDRVALLTSPPAIGDPSPAVQWRGLSPMCPALQSIELAFVRHRAVPAQCIR